MKNKIYTTNEELEFIELIHSEDYARLINRNTAWINNQRKLKKLKEKCIYLKSGYYFLKGE